MLVTRRVILSKKSLNKRKSKYDKRLFKPVRFQAPKKQSFRLD